MTEMVTEKEYDIQYYEIDYKRRLLITSLMNYLGDIATRQSEELGVGIDYLRDQGIAWVLYKWSIDIDRYPVYGEKIKVRTKPYSFKKFYAYRIFEILDLNGNIIARANSVWFLIDIEKRKAIRVTEDMYKAYGISKEKSDVLDIKKLKCPEKIHSEKSFNVRYSDIDTNRHVNNVKYVDWAIETVPLDVVTNYSIKGINITYQKETTYGAVVKVFTEIREEENRYICLHKIVDENDIELTVLETNWEREN